MKKQGVIYDFRWGKTWGEVNLVDSPDFRLIHKITRLVGSGMIVTGIAGFIFTVQPIVTSEISYRLKEIFARPIISVDQTYIEQARAQVEEKEKELVRAYAQQLGLPNSTFSLYIPKINAKSHVVENVNAADPKEYLEALNYGVAHAQGTSFPGMKGGTYLFAHSTNMPWNRTSRNAVFYLLRELEPPKDGKKGDEIYVFFLDKMYKYRVIEKHIVEANDVSWLTQASEGPERLILQTCWPPGTNLKRYMVVAEPVRE